MQGNVNRLPVVGMGLVLAKSPMRGDIKFFWISTSYMHAAIKAVTKACAMHAANTLTAMMVSARCCL